MVWPNTCHAAVSRIVARAPSCLDILHDTAAATGCMQAGSSYRAREALSRVVIALSSKCLTQLSEVRVFDEQRVEAGALAIVSTVSTWPPVQVCHKLYSRSCTVYSISLAVNLTMVYSNSHKYQYRVMVAQLRSEGCYGALVSSLVQMLVCRQVANCKCPVTVVGGSTVCLACDCSKHHAACAFFQHGSMSVPKNPEPLSCWRNVHHRHMIALCVFHA